MNTSLQQLMYVLQMLALPTTAQVRLDVNDRGRVERLSCSFKHWHSIIQTRPDVQLSPAQKEVLARLENKLNGLTREGHVSNWPEMRLRRSSEWRGVRAIARVALVRFDWLLDLPPLEMSVYQPIKGERLDEQRSRIRQANDLSNQNTGTAGRDLVPLV